MSRSFDLPQESRLPSRLDDLDRALADSEEEALRLREKTYQPSSLRPSLEALRRTHLEEAQLAREQLQQDLLEQRETLASRLDQHAMRREKPSFSVPPEYRKVASPELVIPHRQELENPFEQPIRFDTFKDHSPHGADMDDPVYVIPEEPKEIAEQKKRIAQAKHQVFVQEEKIGTKLEAFKAIFDLDPIALKDRTAGLSDRFKFSFLRFGFGLQGTKDVSPADLETLDLERLKSLYRSMGPRRALEDWEEADKVYRTLQDRVTDLNKGLETLKEHPPLERPTSRPPEVRSSLPTSAPAFEPAPSFRAPAAESRASYSSYPTWEDATVPNNDNQDLSPENNEPIEPAEAPVISRFVRRAQLRRQKAQFSEMREPEVFNDKPLDALSFSDTDEVIIPSSIQRQTVAPRERTSAPPMPRTELPSPRHSSSFASNVSEAPTFYPDADDEVADERNTLVEPESALALQERREYEARQELLSKEREHLITILEAVGLPDQPQVPFLRSYDDFVAKQSGLFVESGVPIQDLAYLRDVMIPALHRTLEFIKDSYFHLDDVLAPLDLPPTAKARLLSRFIRSSPLLQLGHILREYSRSPKTKIHFADLATGVNSMANVILEDAQDLVREREEEQARQQSA